MVRMETTTLDALPAELLKAKDALGSYDRLARELDVPVRQVIGWIKGEHRISERHLPGVLTFLGYTIQRPGGWTPAVIMGGRSQRRVSSPAQESASIRYSAQTLATQAVSAQSSDPESANAGIRASQRKVA